MKYNCIAIIIIKKLKKTPSSETILRIRRTTGRGVGVTYVNFLYDTIFGISVTERSDYVSTLPDRPDAMRIGIERVFKNRRISISRFARCSVCRPDSTAVCNSEAYGTHGKENNVAMTLIEIESHRPEEWRTFDNTNKTDYRGNSIGLCREGSMNTGVARLRVRDDARRNWESEEYRSVTE